MEKKRKRTQGRAGMARKSQKRGLGSRERPGGGQRQEKGSMDNMFETLWSRKKFDVLGKKQKKGEKRLVGQSRSVALQKRKNTLLQEYKRQGKGNVFVDRRFGERDEDLAEEDKALLRFQKERQAQINRKSKFTLADDDDEPGETLTHGGMALSNVDDSNDKDSILDDDDPIDPADEDALGFLNFGGGVSAQREDDNNPERQKSRKEVMEDVIAKSKLFKAQKARQKEEDEKIMEKLDGDFSDLVKSGTSISLRPTRKDRLKNLLSGTALKEQDLDGEDQDKPDEFDKLIKEMTFDTRGQAGERLKTAEEKLKEERERLEELEKERKKRMLDDEEESDGESNRSEDDTGNRRQKKKKKMEISGDDLGENFVLDDEEEGREDGWVDKVLARRDDDGGEGESGEEHSSSDEDEDGEAGSEDDRDEEDSSADEEKDDKIIDDDDGALSGDERSRKEVGPSMSKKIQRLEAAELSKKASSEEVDAKKGSGKARKADGLPFVINAPETLAEFRALVDGRSAEEVAVAIRRIRTCNAISLAAENRKKMQVFYSVLLQYFAWLATQKPFQLSTINLITKPLIELSSETPYFAAHCALQWLVKMHDQVTQKLKSPDGVSGWPTLRSILQLRLWSMVFPPTDFRHPVLTPAVLLTAGYLMRCKVTSARDILAGSFLCSLLFSILREARRFCPEVLTFILSILVSALPADANRRALSLCPAFMVELAASNQWMQLTDVAPGDSFDLNFTLISAEESSPIFSTDTFRCGVLQSLLLTLRGFVGLYGDLACFPEAMSPLLQVLQTMDKTMNLLPDKIRNLSSEVANSIEKKLNDCKTTRQPLRMRLKKPTPIKMFNPKFEEDFQPGVNYDPDRERAKRKKLERQIKKEARGAARELRKDNYYLLEEKTREKAEMAAEQKEKYGKAMQFLQMQESAFKSGQLGKGKGRKRRR